MITNSPLEWDSEDMALWRQFLESRAGQHLIPKVADSLPPLLRKGDTNEILIANGMVLGFQAAMATLLALAYPPPVEKETPAGWPALDDDDAWNDGQKIKNAT